MGGEYRKATDIESLLQWAFRYELPKQQNALEHGEVSPMFNVIDLGTRIDDDGPVEPGFPVIMGEPHPDALRVAEAVKRLQPVGLDWKRARARLMPDLLPWVDVADPVLSTMSFTPAAYIVLHARMATRPIWDLGKPRVVRVLSKNGKPKVMHFDEIGTLVEGRTAGRHYGPGAHCVTELDPPAREIACARAEYLVWHSALKALTETLCAWSLQAHSVLHSPAAPEPWIVDTERKSRILQSNLSMASAP